MDKNVSYECYSSRNIASISLVSILPIDIEPTAFYLKEKNIIVSSNNLIKEMNIYIVYNFDFLMHYVAL